MMFLFAGHSAGLLSKNFVKQSFTKFLESQLHGSRRKSYLSAPFFFFITYKITTCERTLIAALQILRKHHRICDTTPCVQRSWTTLAGVSPVTVIASEPCS